MWLIKPKQKKPKKQKKTHHHHHHKTWKNTNKITKSKQILQSKKQKNNPNQTKPNQNKGSGSFLLVASEYTVFSSTLRTSQEINSFLPSILSSWLLITTTEQRGTGLQKKKGGKISFYQIYVALRHDQVHDKGWQLMILGLRKSWLSYMKYSLTMPTPAATHILFLASTTALRWLQGIQSLTALLG